MGWVSGVHGWGWRVSDNYLLDAVQKLTRPSDALLCITHYIDGVAACVRRDIHFADCPRGTCEGCVAKEAVNGFVCPSCWSRLEHAISVWDFEFFPTFANEVRAVQPDPAGARTAASTVPLSALQLTIDAILRLQRSRVVARLWVTTEAGAEDAVRFTRAVEAAVRAFPRKEGAKKIPTTRCPACARRTLVYDPAQAVGAEATVRCLNGECGKVMDHSSFERIALIEAQCCRRCRTDEGCTDRACTCHRLAPVPEWERTSKASEVQVYDPRKRPEHRDLDPLTVHKVKQLQAIALELGIARVKQLRKPELIAAIRERS